MTIYRRYKGNKLTNSVWVVRELYKKGYVFDGRGVERDSICES